MFYVRNGISVNILEVSEDYEVLSLLISSNQISKSFIVIGAYHPPLPNYSSLDLLSYLVDRINSFANTHSNCVIIVIGDLNQLDINPIIDETDLVNVPIGPTRGDSCLDRVLLTHPNYYSSIEAVDINMFTDHKAILLSPKYRVPAERCNATFHDLSFYNQCRFNEYMNNLDFSFVYNSIDTNIVDDIDSLILDGFLSCFPIITVKMSNKDPAWVTPRIKHIINLKNRAKKHGQIAKSEALAKKVAKMKNSEHLSKGSRDWWKNVNTITKFKHSNKRINFEVFDPCTVNEELANRSRSNYNEMTPPSVDPNDKLDSIPMQLVYDLLTSVKKTAAGPNKIPYWVYKKFSDILTPPLHYVWNLILLTGQIPLSYKSANIIPIPKVNNPSITNDIRGISVTNIASRLHEKAVNYLYIKPSFEKVCDNYQFGFRSKLSTCDALLSLQHYISHILDKNQGSTVHCLSIDFAKAFDSVRPDVFMKKLPTIIPNTYIQRWMFSFLTQRQQRLIWKGEELKFQGINCGCSQGTVTGPVIWNIFSNDLQVSHNSFDTVVQNALPVFLKYADDTNCLIPCLANKTDSTQFTTVYNFINDWCNVNKISLNSSKCTHMKFSNLNSDVCKCSDGLCDFKECSIAKILGVHLSSRMNFSVHCDKILKALRQKKFIFKDLRLNKSPLSDIHLIFESLCISKILYGLSVYSHDIRSTSKINNYLRRSFEKKNSSQLFEIKTLRDKFDTKMCSKIKNNKRHPLHSVIPIKFVHKRSGDVRRPHSRTALAANSFMNRNIACW